MNEDKNLRTADAGFTAKLGRVGEFLSQNWLRLAALVVTGVLTGYAGWNLTHQWFYTVSLVALAEGASLFWTARASDNGNGTQEWLSYIGATIAWIAIIVTDLASATILAKGADAEIFSVFREVPKWAQNVVTYVLPSLAVLHGILGTTHHYFSETAKLSRDVSRIKRDAKREIAEAEAEAQKNIAKAEANRYRELAEQNAAQIGVTRGESLWQKSYSRNVSVVTPDDNSNDNGNDNGEVGQPVPFPPNGSKKRSH